MKIFFKTLVCLCIPVVACGQQHYTDSLKRALGSAKTDSARFSTLGDLTYYYAATDLKAGLYYADQRIAIARRNDKELDVSSSLLMKGYMTLLAHRYIESLQYLEQALKIADDPKNENKGWYRGDYFNPAKNRVDIIANIHLSWGHLMNATGNTSEAIEQYSETVKFAKEAADRGLVAWGEEGLGEMYFYNLDKPDTALMYAKKALPVIDGDYKQLFGNIGIKKYVSQTDVLIASIYLKKHDDKLALYYFHKGVYDGIKQVDPNHLSDCYSELANYYLDKKNADSGLYYSKKELEALHHATTNNYSYGLTDLYESYKLKGLKDSAYKYEDLAMIAKDSVYDASQTNLSDFQKQLFNQQLQLRDLEKKRIATEDKNKTIAFITGLVFILLLALIFYRNFKRSKAANVLLLQQKEEIATTLSQLKSAQNQLVQREKMASMGELTAGIAHEIQNPLNFVNNFSDVNCEMLEELKYELKAGHTDEVLSLAEDIQQNEEKINHHGKRADAIVKGMLQHSRTTTGERQLTDINLLSAEFLKLSYQGLRARDKSFSVEIVTDFDQGLPKLEIVPQDIGRVLINIFNNAFYAVNEKQRSAGANYKPTVEVSTTSANGQVNIRVKDNGIGIPAAIRDKIMQPFFTTKPTGEGTGLGLSLSYDIVVKGHGGSIAVDTTEGEFTAFTIQLPI